MGALIIELSNSLIVWLNSIELLRTGTFFSTFILFLLTAAAGLAFVYAIYSLLQSIL